MRKPLLQPSTHTSDNSAPKWRRVMEEASPRLQDAVVIDGLLDEVVVVVPCSVLDSARAATKIRGLLYLRVPQALDQLPLEFILKSSHVQFGIYNPALPDTLQNSIYNTHYVDGMFHHFYCVALSQLLWPHPLVHGISRCLHVL